MRTRIGVLVLVASLLTGLLAVPALADVDTGAEASFVALLNAEREAVGLPSLTVAADLTAVARGQSVRMADADDLFHNPDLPNAVAGWQKVGENVGRGPQVQAIHDAFMNSPAHRENILDPAYTEIGLGVELRDGRYWVTQVFRRPATPAPAPEATPTNETAVAGAAVTAPPAAAPADSEPATGPHVAAAPDDTGRLTLVLARVEADEQAVPVDSLLD